MQVQRRLGSCKGIRRARRLVADYRTGSKVRNLANHYRISRSTVLEHITQAGVRKHYAALIPAEIAEAAQLYRSGRSLTAVGEHFGVNASTVRSALQKGGVEMRDCQWRER
jgi:transposase